MNWTWTIRTGDGGMNGLEFAQALTAGGVRRILVHAAPDRMEIEVRTAGGETVAASRPRREGDYSPITELTIEEDDVLRREVWPTGDHLGLPVILPGGEAGVLTTWHNAEDRSWWRWSVEFSNHRDRPDDWSPPPDGPA